MHSYNGESGGEGHIPY